MLVTDYLNAVGSLDTLVSQYALKAMRHKKHPNLVSLKYDQINSPLDRLIVQQCRGVVLDEADNWRCVARGFDKFFNYGEGHAAEIDWTTAQVQEKVDGSLCMLYWYAGEWQVATTGLADASGSVGGFWTGTFADLFWRAWLDEGYQLRNMAPTAKCFTWLFELTTPHNRIVVPHTDYKLTLLAIRSPQGMYFPLDDEMPFRMVRSFPLTSVGEIAASFEHINPLQQEGYVVVDGQGRRIKVKHPQYVALHHLKEGASPKGFVDVIRQGEVPELLASFPELEAQFTSYKARYDALCEQVATDYQALEHIPVQKDFALEAVKTTCPAALFAIRSKKAGSPRVYFAGCNLDNLVRLLEAA